MTDPFGGALAAAPDGDGKLFLIVLKEHFATRELQRLNPGTDKRLFSGGGRRPELLDLSAGRIAGAVVAGWPDRFRAFATLPLSQPEAAADELKRSVREHGFVGCMSYGPIDGRFLDHADFAPPLARAELLALALATMGEGRITFSVDYPMASARAGPAGSGPSTCPGRRRRRSRTGTRRGC